MTHKVQSTTHVLTTDTCTVIANRIMKIAARAYFRKSTWQHEHCVLSPRNHLISQLLTRLNAQCCKPQRKADVFPPPTLLYLQSPWHPKVMWSDSIKTHLTLSLFNTLTVHNQGRWQNIHGNGIAWSNKIVSFKMSAVEKNTKPWFS